MKKFLGGLIAIALLGALLVSSYGLGEDLLGWLPLWLTKGILGFVFFILGTIIAIVFALGIVKIREITKNQE